MFFFGVLGALTYKRKSEPLIEERRDLVGHREPAPSQRAQPAAYAASQAAQLQQRSRLGRRTSQEAGASKAADMGTCWFCSHRDRVKYALEWAQNIMFTSSVAVVALPLSWASTNRPAEKDATLRPRELAAM